MKLIMVRFLTNLTQLGIWLAHSGFITNEVLDRVLSQRIGQFWKVSDSFHFSDARNPLQLLKTCDPTYQKDFLLQHVRSGEWFDEVLLKSGLSATNLLGEVQLCFNLIILCLQEKAVYQFKLLVKLYSSFSQHADLNWLSYIQSTLLESLNSAIYEEEELNDILLDLNISDLT